MMDQYQYNGFNESTQDQNDRVTGILQSIAAQRPPSNSPPALPSMMPQAILPQQQIRPLDMLKQKIATGDPQASALDNKIKMFVGNDQTAYDSAAQFLIDHPNDIDPGNSFQTNTALAQWSKQSGYNQQALQPKMPNPQETYMQAASNIAAGQPGNYFGIQQDAAKNISDINLQQARASGQVGASGGGTTQFVYNKLSSALQNAGVQITPELDLQLVNASRTGLRPGMTFNINGQQVGIENIPGMTDAVAAQESATQNAKNQSDLGFAFPTAQEAASGRISGETIGAYGKKEMQARDNTFVIGKILEKDQRGRDLLDKATGSGIGNLVAMGKQAIGKSDESTQANSQLEIYGGQLLNNVPRMEGPQSNADLSTYKEQAGKIANRNIPAADKRAALAAIDSITAKYAYLNASGNNAPKPPAKRVKYDNQGNIVQ